MARKRSLFFRRIQSLLGWQMPLLSLAIALSIVFLPVKTTAVSSATTPETDLLQQGEDFYNRQQYSDAVEILQQAVSSFEQQGDRQGMAIALSNLSLAYQQLGEWQPAERAISDSLKLLPTVDAETDIAPEQAHILAQALNVRGRLELKQGRNRAALDTWQQTTALYERLEDKVGMIRSQVNQAQAMNHLGMYFRAENILIKTLGQFTDKEDSALKATALRSLGNVYQGMGDFERSQQTLEQSLTVAEAVGAPTVDILLSLGNIARARNQPQAALNFYQQAIDNTVTLETRIQAQLNQLNLIGKENPQAALNLSDRIESQLASLPPSHAAVYARINLAENWQKFNNNNENSNLFSEAKLIRLLTEAKQQALTIDDRAGTSYALGNLAEIYAQKGQSKKAIALNQQALYWGQIVNDPSITYRWQWQLGKLQNKLGKTTEAIAAYTEAVNNLQQLRRDSIALDPKIKFNFRERVEPVYRQLVDLLLKSEPTQANLVSARQTLESLQLLELEDFFRQACLEPKVEIDRIVSRDSSTAVVYPIVLADRLEIIVKLSNREQLLHFTTSVGEEQFKTTASLLRGDLLDVTKTARVKQRSQQLYSWMIAPLKSTLEEDKIDTLVFVLDGSLRNIPMSVLYDRKRQQYLIEQYAIAVAPGLQLVESKPFEPSNLNVLAGGISQSRTVAERDFSPLSNVPQELEQIQSRAAKSRQIIDREFTKANLQNQLATSDFSTVHLATHGKFSSDPEQTFILTWNELLKTQDFTSLMRQYATDRDRALELLVLSACETATGDPLAALGLAGITVRAGVRSTLASLWFVDDRFSAEFMSNFYRELSQGSTKAKALQKSQIAILRQEKRPYFWSSFTLLGNWL